MRIRNPSDQSMIVWLEPWADRFDLASGKSLDIVFIGPKNGSPEIVPRLGEVSVYGWDGSEAIAVCDGHLALRQPSVDEIVQQELELGKLKIGFTDRGLPRDDIVMTQDFLDSIPELQPSSAPELFKATAYLISESLAPALQKSAGAADALWKIANRTIATKGFLLVALRRRALESFFWKGSPAAVIDLIRKQSVFVLDSVTSRAISTTQQPAESESDSTS